MLEHSIANWLSSVSSALVAQIAKHPCSELWRVAILCELAGGSNGTGGVMLGAVVSKVLVSWCPVVAEVFL